MLVLPYHGRQAWVRAFWLAMALWAGLIVGVFLPGGHGRRTLAAVVAAILVGAVPLVRPREAGRLYRLWVRASRLYARTARYLVLALCYGMVFVAVGVAGSALRLRRPEAGDSLWEAGRTLTTDTYRSQHETAKASESGSRWRAVVTWAAESGNAWAFALVPFLLLSVALDTDEEAPYPVGIYTLF